MEVHENQSKGTMVGVFASEDPDGKLSGKHRFELIEPKDEPFDVFDLQFLEGFLHLFGDILGKLGDA